VLNPLIVLVSKLTVIGFGSTPNALFAVLATTLKQRNTKTATFPTT
jgi:hypothetical protein